MTDGMRRRLAPMWMTLVLVAGVLGWGVWQDHQAELARVEATCTALTATERVIEGLLALPGAADPRNAPAVRDYQGQLEDLAAAEQRLTGGTCD